MSLLTYELIPETEALTDIAQSWKETMEKWWMNDFLQVSKNLRVSILEISVGREYP
jgi:hypothetical protein